MKWDSTHGISYNRFIIQRYNVTNQILTLERILNAGVSRLAYSLFGYRLLASFIDRVIQSQWASGSSTTSVSYTGIDFLAALNALLDRHCILYFTNRVCVCVFSSRYHYHHHVAPPAQISLTLSRHPSLSSIASGRSSSLHPVSAQNCGM